MLAPAKPLPVDELQGQRLRVLVTSGKTPQKITLRARIVLLAADGTAHNAIAGALGVSRPTVLLWRNRFTRLGVPGLMQEAKRSGRPRVLAPGQVQAVVDATMHTTTPTRTCSPGPRMLTPSSPGPGPGRRGPEEESRGPRSAP